MTWLVRLYPPAWRRRYGRELEELIATQPASLAMAVDLMAAAVDAWLHPQSSTASTGGMKGTGAMSEMLKLKCAGCGPAVTSADNRKAAVVMLAGTLAMVVALVWAMSLYPKNPYLESLLLVSWMIPSLVSQRYTTLKGRPAGVQMVLIAAPAAVVIAIVLAAAWFSSR